jgi:putative cell wall-binding protein/uncharacterized coiled-coil protein SlyX
MKKVFNSKVAIALVALLILGALSVSGMLHDVSATPVDRVDRVYGSNRSGTAVAISQEGWETSDYVVLARGDEFADALAGVPLAYSLDAPILLTHSAILTASTKQEIIELNAKNVIILGGKGAISKAVEDELISMGLTVDRISGANRNDTASQIALRMKAAGTYNGKIFVANGLDFPDALAASAYAAKLGYPILLSLPDRIPVSTQTAIDELSPEAAYIAGGTAVISNAVMGNLPSPKRLSGPNRYATATALAEEFKPGNVKYYVATGFDFADAIAGGVLAAKNDAGLLLVSRIVPAPVIEYIADYPVYYATIFGGTGAVNTYIENELEILLDSAALAQAILAAQAAIDALPGQVAASADSAEAQGYIDAAQDLVDAVLEIDPDHDTSEWDAVIAEQQAIVDDMRAAEAVIAQIAALEPVDELTLDDKAAVEAARAAYEALTDDQKALVTNLAVLEAAEARIAQLEADLAAANAVIAQIAALEPVDELTLDDKAAVEAARAAYEALTDDQKALVTNLAVLEAAEARIAQLEADLAAANAVIAQIAALEPVDELTLDDKAAVEAARAAYEALTDDQKALVTNLAVLEAAEARIAQLEADLAAANAVIAQIAALEPVDELTLDDKAAVEAARAAYEALTDDQKALVTNLAVLEAAEARIAQLEADLAAANAVIAQIAALEPVDELTLDDKAAVEAARAAYEALTDDQKALVTNLAVLEAAEARIAQLEADLAAANAVIAQIAALEPVDELTLDDKAAVEAARAAYEALTDDQKALVTNLAVLEAAEARIAQLEADLAAANAVIAQIAALEPVDELTLDDKAAVEAARAAYEALTDDQKALVTNLAVLEAAEARIAQLEADLAAANAVIAQIAALEPVDELTLDDKAAVEAARAAYEALTDDQKALVTNLAVLEAAEARSDCSTGSRFGRCQCSYCSDCCPGAGGRAYPRRQSCRRSSPCRLRGIEPTTRKQLLLVTNLPSKQCIGSRWRPGLLNWKPIWPLPMQLLLRLLPWSRWTNLPSTTKLPSKQPVPLTRH